jgi:FtsP/CotA-like multicopper oxidase with cupredoxin domain
MCLALDDLELGLISSGVLPGIRGVSDVGPEYRNPYDLPLVIRDDIFDSTGAIRYTTNELNGYLGNVARVNGQAYPFMRVERRKYRFRVLVASNARVWRFRLSDNSTFLRIGKDFSLFPRPQTTQCFLAGPATRADVVIDFSKYRVGQEIFLENILPQKDPRGPGDKLEDVNGTTVTGTPPFRHRVLRFVVGERDTRFPDASITATSTLRPYVPIAASEVVARRTFCFERKNGAWAINGQFWNQDLVNAIPQLGTTEEWTIKNGSGGWWHPIHMHLEGHQQVADVRTGRPIQYHDSFLSDTTMLGPNSEFRVRMRFRTFKGPFVFHCHTIEHEDMDMMFQFDPRNPMTASTLPQQWFP